MKKAVWMAALVLSSTVLVACGGDDSDDESHDVNTYCPTGDQTSGGGGETLVVSAEKSGAPKFKPTSLEAQPGKVTIELDNPSSQCHDIAVKTPDGDLLGNTERVKEGAASVAFDVDSGRYIYYSTIPGEQDAGMRGTLTVE